MNLSDLQAMGGFVDSEPVKKDVKWKLGDKEHKAVITVVRQAFGSVERALRDEGDKADSRSHGARMISMCVRLGEDGDEQLTYEQAYSLQPQIAWAFVGAINEVNNPKA